MKILIIGGCGHIGSYLVKELVANEHEVFVVSRGNRLPYAYDESVWNKVKTIRASREELLQSDIFEKEKFDAVCDLVSFEISQVQALVEKLTHGEFFLHVGSIWTYENKIYLPVDENHPHNATSAYGKGKGEIEEYLIALSKAGKLRCSIVHPGHISAKEWRPVNPQGNLDESVYEKIYKGEEIILPFYGLPTFQHVHAADLSAIITACLTQSDKANGEAFIAVARTCMTMRSMSEELYTRFGHEPNIRYVSEKEFRETVGEENYEISMDHILHSPCCSVEKSVNLLGVAPKYTIADILEEYMKYTYEK